MKIDRRLIEPRVAGRDAQHLAIAHALGRSDADREHGRPAGGSRAAACLRLPRIGTVGQQDNPRHSLAARAIANRGERASQIGAARVGAERVDAGRLQRLADAVQLRLEIARQRRKQLRAEHGRRAREPRLAVRIAKAHAAGHVDEHRHDAVARALRRQQHDRPP